MESLVNKVVLITGASTGIGGFTAKYLSKFKTKLVLVARSEDRLKKVQQQCEEGCGKGNVVTVTADLEKQEELSRVILEAISAFGKLDVLVNNAASFLVNDMEHTTPEEFDSSMAVVIRAPFFLTQAAAPHLKKTKGCIINISSICAVLGFKQASAYSVGKAALDQFTKVSALELGPYGVRVNAIRVGYTVTDSHRELIQYTAANDWSDDFGVFTAEHKKFVPLGDRLMNMEDVAKVISFLASDLSSAMTGSCFAVDKGTLVVPPLPEPSGLDNNGVQFGKPFEVVIEELKATTMAAKTGKNGDGKPGSK